MCHGEEEGDEEEEEGDKMVMLKVLVVVVRLSAHWRQAAKSMDEMEMQLDLIEQEEVVGEEEKKEKV